MTTRTPNEIAEELQRFVADEFSVGRLDEEFRLPFLRAGWEPVSDWLMKRVIKSRFEDKAVNLYAHYWEHNNRPVLIQFDETGSQWFHTAGEAIEFTEKVINEFEERVTSEVE